MSDQTMDSIKSGNGLPPVSNSSNSNGTTTEQRAGNGVTHETFTYHGNGQDKSNTKDK